VRYRVPQQLRLPFQFRTRGSAFTAITLTIQTELSRLERDEPIHTLYACESGSRAWSLASRDSDYDVRFIYVRPLDWYLSLKRGRDVLEQQCPYDLDLSGWDVRKALKLFAKSNPILLEWLSSPIVYREEKGFTDALRALLPDYYAPRACMYHYLHMAKGNYWEYLKGETVWTKKYLYVLRPILACRWIEAGHGPVPMEMAVLVDALLQGERKAAIQELIARKQQGEELERGPRLPVLDTLIEEALSQLEDAPKAQVQPRTIMTALDDLFRQTVGRYAP